MQERVRGKCYGVIFVCFASRVVHVDVSKDNSTDSFLQVMRRFASIRGRPERVYSARGTQLVAASKELMEAFKQLDWSALQEHGIRHKLEWSFYPADAAWTNGRLASTPLIQMMGVSSAQTTCYLLHKAHSSKGLVTDIGSTSSSR